MLETVEALERFVRSPNPDKPSHDFWLVGSKKLSAALAGPQGYVPEGLYEYAPRGVDDLIRHLCDPTTDENTVFQVVTLDAKADKPVDIVTRAIRWQGIPEHDAMLVFSTSEGRFEEARQALPGTPPLLSQAIFLIDARALVR